jgi:hypothetical protein
MFLREVERQPQAGLFDDRGREPMSERKRVEWVAEEMPEAVRRRASPWGRTLFLGLFDAFESRAKLSSKASIVGMVGRIFVNPFEYLKPMGQATSKSPAINKYNQSILFSSCNNKKELHGNARFFVREIK